MAQFSSNKKAPNKQVVTGGKARTVQAKPEVNQPGDRYEQEADAMAKKVIAAENDPKKGAVAPSTGLIGKSFQSPAKNDHSSVSDSFITRLDNTAGGSRLPETTREKMEQVFGADFSGVRIFADENAAALSRTIQARAFTYNDKIVFNRGTYSTDTPEGRKLLAHELTHVLQQRNGLHLIQRDDLVLPPIETFRQIWSQFEEAQQGFRTAEALQLALRLAGMYMDLDDTDQHGLELALYLMNNGHMTEGLQVLQNCEGFFWIRYVSLHPSPHRWLESYYIGQLRDQGVQAARRQDWTTAFRILGLIVLYDQIELSFANSQKIGRAHV